MKKMNLMVVDDHPVYRKTLRVLLEQQGNFGKIDEAANGLECLEILGEQPPDLILMDIQMPGMNGIETTKAIREKYPDAKILGISMFPSKDDIEKMREKGASGFVGKDQSISTLLTAIRCVLAGGSYFEPNYQIENQ